MGFQRHHRLFLDLGEAYELTYALELYVSQCDKENAELAMSLWRRLKQIIKTAEKKAA